MALSLTPQLLSNISKGDQKRRNRSYLDSHDAFEPFKD